MIRDRLTVDGLQEARREVAAGVSRRVREKGDGAFVSSHEAFGVIAEEFNEMLDAMTANDFGGFHDEVVDVAVACVIALGSMRAEERT